MTPERRRAVALFRRELALLLRREAGCPACAAAFVLHTEFPGARAVCAAHERARVELVQRAEVPAEPRKRPRSGQIQG